MAIIALLEALYAASLFFVFCLKDVLAGYKIFSYSTISAPFVALVVSLAVYAALCSFFIFSGKISRSIASFINSGFVMHDFQPIMVTVMLTAIAAIGPYLAACNAYGCFVIGKGLSLRGNEISLLLAPVLVMFISWISVIAFVHAVFERQDKLIKQARYVLGLQFACTFLALFAFM